MMEWIWKIDLPNSYRLIKSCSRPRIIIVWRTCTRVSSTFLCVTSRTHRRTQTDTIYNHSNQHKKSYFISGFEKSFFCCHELLHLIECLTNKFTSSLRVFIFHHNWSSVSWNLISVLFKSWTNELTNYIYNHSK